MTRTRLVLEALVLVVGVVLDCRAGTHVELKSSPIEIDSCTSSLTVRCALSTSTVTDVNPEEDIDHLTSITISRNGVIVSTITFVSQPQVVSKVDIANAKVTGDLKVNDGTEKGYLQLDWSFPQANQTGKYKCEVRGMTGSNHLALMTQTLEVKVETNDMVAKIRCLERLFQEQQKQIDAEKARNDQQQTIIAKQQRHATIEQQQKIDAEKSRNDQQQISILQLQSTISQQQAKIDSLTTELSRVSHVEQGYIDCRGSDTWHDGSYDIDLPVMDWWKAFGVSKSVRVSFKTPFVKPPVVQLSIDTFFNSGESNEYYSAVVEKVDTDGFTMRCLSFNNKNYKVYDMDVSWIGVATS